MFNSLTKILVVAAMLIAFIGQALAFSAMSCDMSDTHNMHVNMGHQISSYGKMSGHISDTKMSHAEMGHVSSEHNELENDITSLTSQQDCCETDCVCPANACSSGSYLNASYHSIMMVRTDVNAIVHRSAAPQSVTSSLYRPPIFA